MNKLNFACGIIFLAATQSQALNDHQLSTLKMTIKPLQHYSFEGKKNIAEEAALQGTGISEIVNIGVAAWDLIVENKATNTFRTSYAMAMPEGANWQDLNSWQKIAPPLCYQVNYENFIGITVIKFNICYDYFFDGNYKGKGKYLANLMIIPQEVAVSWGYDLNADIRVGTILNAGTEKHPVAALQTIVTWSIDTALSTRTDSKIVTIYGDGRIDY